MRGSRGSRLLTTMAVVACAALPQVLGAAEPPAPAADANALAALWDDLGSPKSSKVATAALKLVREGDSAVGFLGRKLEVRKTVVNAERIAQLLRELDANSWQRREKAQEELSRIGPPVAPFLREQLQKKPSPEVRVRVQAILAEWDARASGSPAALRRQRALALLGQIASARALNALLAVRAQVIELDRPWLDTALLNLAERALPRLIDAAGRAAAAGDTAAAERACAKALAIAEKTGHYSQGRIRAILAGLGAGGKGKAAGRAKPPIRWVSVRGSNALGNAGFENKRWQSSWPTKGGIWGGDHADMVAAERGVKPREGAGMLRFGATNFHSAGSTSGAQVVQVIELAKFKQAVGSGKARAVATVFFNRVAGDAQTDTLLLMDLMAYPGSPVRHFQMSKEYRWLARRGAAIHTDADPSTWEKLTVRLPVPKASGFLVIQIAAAEDIFNDLRAPEFDGHYADSAFVTVVRPGPDDKGGELIPPPQRPPVRAQPPRPAAPAPHRRLRLHQWNASTGIRPVRHE